MVQHNIRGFDRLMSFLVKLGYTQRIKVKNRYGARFSLDPFNYIDRIVLKEGYYESEVLECILYKININEVFWDIGANIGLHSITLNYLKRDVQVFSFEPFPSIMHCLLKNAKLNQATIHKIAIGLSDKTELSSILFVKGNSGMTTILPWPSLKSDDQVSIATFTIDHLIEKYNLPEPHMIKIDTEGSELNIFNGAHNLLKGKQLHTIIFEAGNDFILKPSKLKTLLTKHGFEFSILCREENTAHNLSNFSACR
jgi:FkbM family methyltransferase